MVSFLWLYGWESDDIDVFFKKKKSLKIDIQKYNSYFLYFFFKIAPICRNCNQNSKTSGYQFSTPKTSRNCLIFISMPLLPPPTSIILQPNPQPPAQTVQCNSVIYFLKIDTFSLIGFEQPRPSNINQTNLLVHGNAKKTTRFSLCLPPPPP